MAIYRINSQAGALMKLTFQVRYHTHPGQSLWLCGNHELPGCEWEEGAVRMRYRDTETWSVTFDLPRDAAPDVEFNYNYRLCSPDGSQVSDWGNDRAVNPASFHKEEVTIIDSWNEAGFYENAFYTEPFQGILLKPDQTEVRGPSPARVTHIFKVKAPLLAGGRTLCLLGNTPALGNWNTCAPVLLNRAEGEAFHFVELDLTDAAFPLAYKYGVYDGNRKAFARYEGGANRILNTDAAPNRLTIVNDGFAVLPNTTWRGAGVAIPVFSLRSETSFGVGEFTDLEPLADWCALTGLKVIQILPVNDTSATRTWTDSYPYSAISAFALHPQYLNLGRVATGRNQTLLKGLEPERKRLNELAELDYEAVIKTKLAFIKRIFASQKTKTFKSRDYRRFFAANKHWLVPYAAFCFLRDRFDTADFSRWPGFSGYREEEIAKLTDESSQAGDEIALNYFIQYHLHRQLREARDYAHTRGVILKGDIAIGVSRHSADAWQHPELYHMNTQAGAPPDAFAVKGQNWGFPTYDWPRMKADGFAWWRRRFEQMANYFDAFRVDHILGFFRIWSIPLDAVEGILGRFVPAIPVEAEEFSRRGIVFDRERFVQPFITDEILRDIFGPDAEDVKRRYLDPKPNARFALKKQFATQRRVEEHFASRAPTACNRKFKLGLFDLISNVILLEDETMPGRHFHFRFDIRACTSFQALDPATRAQLQELYVDYFHRRQDDFWRREGLQKLPALKRATNLLICGEDLGVVPPCVPEAMRQLGLLSLEIQRMPKNPEQEFFRPSGAPYLAVVTPSTHDMSTIRGWWREDRKLTQKFFNTELGRPGDAPADCDPTINREIVAQHLAGSSMWSIFQLQDLLGLDGRLRRANPDEERVNVPAIPNYYWRYRMHLTLETLLAEEAFGRELAQLVRENGR